MGRELEEELIRTHQPRSPKEKGGGSPNLLNDLVNRRITLGSSRPGEPNFEAGAATFWGRYRILDQETESFSRV